MLKSKLNIIYNNYHYIIKTYIIIWRDRPSSNFQPLVRAVHGKFILAGSKYIEVWLWLIFKIFFMLKYIKMILFFLFF
jgi:hypothetical protein